MKSCMTLKGQPTTKEKTCSEKILRCTSHVNPAADHDETVNGPVATSFRPSASSVLLYVLSRLISTTKGQQMGIKIPSRSSNLHEKYPYHQSQQ